MSFIKLEELFDFKEKKGYDKKEIIATEERLKVEFPKVLKQLYINYGKDELLNSYNHFVPLNDLNFHLSDWLTIYLDSQGMCCWAINKKDFTQKECKVYCIWDEFQYEEDSSLENFLIKIAFQQSNAIFPFILKTNQIEPHDDKIISASFGQLKSEIVLDHFNSKYYWSEYNELITIGGHNGKQQLCLRCKDKNQLYNFKKLFSKREWELK